MTPTELRQAVDADVEAHMREKGVWPEHLAWVYRTGVGFDRFIPGWFIESPTGPWEPAHVSHAAALIGWAIEGQLIRTHYTAWDKSGGYCVYAVGDPALQVIESHNDRLHALVAAYRRIVMGESK